MYVLTDDKQNDGGGDTRETGIKEFAPVWRQFDILPSVMPVSINDIKTFYP